MAWKIYLFWSPLIHNPSRLKEGKHRVSKRMGTKGTEGGMCIATPPRENQKNGKEGMGSTFKQPITKLTTTLKRGLSKRKNALTKCP